MLPLRAFDQSFRDRPGHLGRASLTESVALAACEGLTDGFRVRVWHVIERDKGDRGVFVLRGCYQGRKRAEKETRFYCFMPSADASSSPRDARLKGCRWV